MAHPEQEVVEHKVKHVVARNALHKISGIVAQEQKTDADKDKYTRWFLRYGIVLLLLACAVLARYLGVY